VQVALLGPFEIRNDSGELLPVAGTRLRALIARLALAGGRPVSTSELAEAVWGDDPPADFGNALQTLVSRARRALGGPAAVEQSPAGYRLAVGPDDVDALRFERLVAADRAAEALDLWRGPALGDVGAVGEWAVPVGVRLDGLRLEATITLLAREVGAGHDGRHGRRQGAGHVAELTALAAAHPLNEKVAALLMRALAVAGRQAEALALFEELRGRLAEELGIDPGPEIAAVHLEVLRGKVPVATDDRGPAGAAPDHGGMRRRSNLRTPLTSFVGREDEVARVGAALDSYRLVTLVGPGGAGKTRLAAEVAAQVAAGSPERAPDGVWMAELASVTDAADVAQVVLGSIGLRESRVLIDSVGGSQRAATRDAQSRLLDGLADARALLVLDNCEHLIDACAELADTLLAHSPRLRIVATSREPLGITGESLLVVPPLAVDPAVRLFADRAAAVSPGFTLDSTADPAADPDSVALVADIVARLDGLPLAIELAAARLRTLPLAEISRRLSDRFRLLTGGSRTALPRHRTLRAVVEWSWDLLTPAERLLAERFAVFPAGATPDAVAAVCGSEEEVDDLLSSLVDKSLLQPASEGTRLRMLETIREFGSERLAARGEVPELRRRHAAYYSDLMASVAPKLVTRDQLTWLRVIEAERDNILAALHYWCDTGDAERALSLAVSASTLALLLGNNADMAAWIGEALAVAGPADPELRTIAEALYVVNSAVGTGEPSRDDGMASFAELSDRVDSLDIGRYPLVGLIRPVFAMFSHDQERLQRYLDEAFASPDEWLVAATWMVSASVAENDGDLPRMRAAGARALELFRSLGERWGLSGALRIAGELRVLDGDLDGAAAAYEEAVAVLQEMGSTDDEMHLELQLASLAIRRGDIDAARSVFEAAWERMDSEAGSMEQAMVAIWCGMFEATDGSVDQAREMHRIAELRLARVGPQIPVRNHMAGLLGALGVLIALADGDPELARARAKAAYQSAVAARDMPLLSAVAGPLALYAAERGEPERAARMLGAADSARGTPDPTDPMTVRLTVRLSAELGVDRFAQARASGRGLPRPEAIALLDPRFV
jgi:predicted ATPase/DNA-binding SARP family transcriptional activator